MVIVQIIRELPLAALIVLIPAPDLQLYDKLLAEVIHDDIRAPLISGLRLDVVVPSAVDDRPQIEQEEASISNIPSWIKWLLSRTAASPIRFAESLRASSFSDRK